MVIFHSYVSLPEGPFLRNKQHMTKLAVDTVWSWSLGQKKPPRRAPSGAGSFIRKSWQEEVGILGGVRSGPVLIILVLDRITIGYDRITTGLHDAKKHLISGSNYFKLWELQA